MHTFRLFSTLAFFVACPGIATAQSFFDDFDANTSALYSTAATTDTKVTFAYDYSAMGIPSAPNSNGTTIGVKFEANVSAGAANAATLHTPLKFTGDYVVTFDAWVNANGPFPAGGTGSTEFFTCGVGGDGATVNLGGTTGSGAWFAVSGEGGSSRDYRGYKDKGEQFAESGQFLAGNSSASGGAHNSSDVYYAKFGSVDVGKLPVQGASNNGPAQQNGTSGAGTFGFAWHEIRIEVDADGGTGGAPLVTWSIDGLAIAKLDAGIGSKFSSDGTVTIGYMDIFSSVSDNAALSFGVVDNLRIGDIAAASNYGTNPAHPTFGKATLKSVDAPRVGQNAAFDLVYAASGTEPGVIVVGAAKLNVPFLGGNLLVNPAITAPIVTTPTNTKFSFAVPNTNSLVGSDFYVQCGVFDKIDPKTPFGIVLSDGLQLHIGL